jgi:hypothetical protein
VKEVRNLVVREERRASEQQQRTVAEKEGTGVRDQGREEVGRAGGTRRAENHDSNRTAPQDSPARDKQHKASVSKGRVEKSL